MEEQINDDSISKIVVSHRSPSFSQAEVKALVDLVDKYKNIILNKCTNSSTNHAKEAAWTKISKEINKKGFTHLRNAESLKTKWENLKREARKTSKNFKRPGNEILCQVTSMINDTESNSTSEIPPELLEEINAANEDQNEPKSWDDFEKQCEDSCDEDENEKSAQNRSYNFSPQECNLLLKCVSDEKKHVFSKERTGIAIKRKNHAWSRITYSFNKLSPQKRTTKNLRIKFHNMKKMAKNVSFKNLLSKNPHQKLEESSEKKQIKSEPTFDINNIDSDDAIEEQYEDDRKNIDFQDLNGISNDCDEQSDPLSTVLKGDSGIGDSASHFGSCSQFEPKEVVKLKIELLKYQLETAKLERQRVISQTRADASQRRSRALEASLRVRAARLGAVAAERGLAPDHPALTYEPHETRARDYMSQFGADR